MTIESNPQTDYPRIEPRDPRLALISLFRLTLTAFFSASTHRPLACSIVIIHCWQSRAEDTRRLIVRPPRGYEVEIWNAKSPVRIKVQYIEVHARDIRSPTTTAWQFVDRHIRYWHWVAVHGLGDFFNQDQNVRAQYRPQSSSTLHLD